MTVRRTGIVLVSLILVVAVVGIVTFNSGGSPHKAVAAKLPAVATPVAALPFVTCGSRGDHCLAPSSSPTISMALIFDYDILANLLGEEKYAHVHYVWGAGQPEPAGGSAEHDHYVAWSQGCLPGKCAPGTPPGFGWLEKHHPNWILWQTNKAGKPTGPAGYKGDPGPIVDFTNPAVESYWMNHFIAPAIREGFNGIDWDNPFLYDPFHAVGHFNTHHKFVRQYSGALQDLRYAKAQVNALGKLLKRVRSINGSAQFSFNSPVDCLYAPMATWKLASKYIQTYVDEEGYSYWGNRITYIPSTPGPYCRNRWLAKTKFYIQQQKDGKHVVLINAQPFAVYPRMTDINPVARAAIQWALANYFLIKARHTYFWFGGNQQYGGSIALQREEQVNLGYPFGGMHTVDGVYVRWYSKGMVLVNPNPKVAFTVTFKAGRYKDLYGQNVDAVTMQPHTGLILVKRTL